MSIFSKVLKKSSHFRTIGSYLFGSSRIALLMGVGDVLGQHYYQNENVTEDIDWYRTAEYATIGFCFMGPTLTFWSRIMRPWTQQLQGRNAVRRIICDQMCLAPSLNLGLIVMSDLVQCKGPKDIERSIGEQYVSLLKNHYSFWPAVQAFCIFFIQPSVQLLFINIFAVGWFTYISSKFYHYDDYTRALSNANYHKIKKYSFF